MRMSGISMKTTVNRLELLETLKRNLASHKEIVREAKIGYCQAAIAELEARLATLKKGEVVELSFAARPPTDYTEVYENTIAMLEWNTQSHVDLTADEFRQLVRDEWDWSAGFYQSNAAYSMSAMSVGRSKKLC